MTHNQQTSLQPSKETAQDLPHEVLLSQFLIFDAGNRLQGQTPSLFCADQGKGVQKTAFRWVCLETGL